MLWLKNLIVVVLVSCLVSISVLYVYEQHVKSGLENSVGGSPSTGVGPKATDTIDEGGTESGGNSKALRMQLAEFKLQLTDLAEQVESLKAGQAAMVDSLRKTRLALLGANPMSGGNLLSAKKLARMSSADLNYLLLGLELGAEADKELAAEFYQLVDRESLTEKDLYFYKVFMNNQSYTEQAEVTISLPPRPEAN